MQNTNFDQLSHSIEKIIHEHMNLVQTHALAAVARSFASIHASISRPTSTKKTMAQSTAHVVNEPRKKRAARQPQAEHEAIKNKLYAAICAQPGESMRFFATNMDVASKKLEKPMQQLRAEKRVNTTGTYQNMRYWPVGEHVATAEAA